VEIAGLQWRKEKEEKTSKEENRTAWSPSQTLNYQSYQSKEGRKSTLAERSDSIQREGKHTEQEKGVKNHLL
jgi:hypothetical protein